MTGLEKAHLVEFVHLARHRGASNAEIAADLRAEADRLHTVTVADALAGAADRRHQQPGAAAQQEQEESHD